MDSSPPGSSVHGTLQARILEWGCYAFLQGIFPTQGLNPCLLLWQGGSLPLIHLGSPPWAIRQMQIETIVRYYYTSNNGKTETKNRETLCAGGGYWETKSLSKFLVGIRNGATISALKHVWSNHFRHPTCNFHRAQELHSWALIPEK